jgi:hypothetical protein
MDTVGIDNLPFIAAAPIAEPPLAGYPGLLWQALSMSVL